MAEEAEVPVVCWADRSGLVTHGPPVHAVLRVECRDCVSNVGPGGLVVASLVGMLLFQQNGAHDDDSCGDLDSGKRRETSFSHGSHLTTLKDAFLYFDCSLLMAY